MNILAIDSASEFLSVALQSATGVTVLEEHAPRQGSGKLLSMVQALLQESALSLSELDLLAWSAGPGSFTGLRMGASVVQALCYGVDLPVLSLSSLAVLAESVRPAEAGWREGGRLAVVVDARMGGVYRADFTLDRHGLPCRMGPDALQSLVKADDAMPLLDASWLVVGDAFSLLREAKLVSGAREIESGLPLAKAVLAIAARSTTPDWLMEPQHCVPFYVRDEVQWKKRARYQ